jgi:Xaa-Pro aminopeptidase
MYGRTESSRLLSLSDSLRKVGHKIKGDRDALLIECLRATKDPGEIRKIRAIGQQAAEVIENVLEMLRECRVVSRKLKLAKRNLTVGRAKSMINTLLAERGLITSEGTIFAVGARSADPHYAGRSSDTVRARTPIMIDLFPMHGDGYWFDLTRTCVIGRAPKKVRAMHDAVLEVQLRALDSMKDGVMGRDLMNSACDLFERRGFITLRSALKANKPAGNVGFIHSLGHGVGLRVSERPYLGLLSDDRLRDGNVVTVEPGLYAPGVGGVRIEDTVLVRRGQVDNLTPLEKELEI